MSRRTQPTTPTPGRRSSVAVIGDSLTHNITLTTPCYRLWTERMAVKLRTAGAGVRGRNFGVNGNTTTDMLARIHELLIYDTPTIAVIFGGVNDPGSSIVAATTTANVTAMIKYLKNGCSTTDVNTGAAVVTLPASLPAFGIEGQRYIVTADNSATGGLNVPTATYPTVTGVATGVQVWECRNSLAGVTGWSRVATLPTPIVSKFIVVSPQFLNYTSGGDTVGAANSHSGQNATYAAVDAALQTAATAESAVFFDLYAYLQQRIIDGKDTALSASWHYANTNQHFNDYGHDLVGAGVSAKIQAQSGWLAALQA